MAIPGPKPTPSAIRRQNGNRGHRPINDNEPVITEVPFGPPAFLTPGALVEWNYYYPLLSKSRVIRPTDRTALHAYCVAVDRFNRMEKNIAAKGEVVESPKTRTPMINPYLSVSKAAQDAILKFGAELGLSPSSRTRLHVETPKSNSFADKFLAVAQREADDSSIQ